LLPVPVADTGPTDQL